MKYRPVCIYLDTFLMTITNMGMNVKNLEFLENFMKYLVVNDLQSKFALKVLGLFWFVVYNPRFQGYFAVVMAVSPLVVSINAVELQCLENFLVR